MCDGSSGICSTQQTLCSSYVFTGIVIVGEDTVGRYDLGIFVASIVPGGPADKDGRIRAGMDSCGYFT